MIENLRTLWQQRSLREQRLLLVMAALAAVVILWLGILRPLTDAKVAARARLDRVTVEAGQIAADAESLRLARRAAPPPLLATLAVAVGEAASASGFDITRLDQQGPDRVSIGIPAVKSNALFAWVNALSRQGVFVESLSIRPNSDATLSVEAVMRSRGA